jgi:hypothetical protein
MDGGTQAGYGSLTLSPWNKFRDMGYHSIITDVCCFPMRHRLDIECARLISQSPKLGLVRLYAVCLASKGVAEAHVLIHKYYKRRVTR